MAHFAELNGDNVVTRVVVIDNEILINEEGVEDENLGIQYCNHFFRATKSQLTKWVQTSYNSKIRVRYAFPGCTYNEHFDAFIPPKPFDSWILDETEFDWISPLGKSPQVSNQESELGYFYYWDNNLYLSDNTRGWVFDRLCCPEINGCEISNYGDEILMDFTKKIIEIPYDVNRLNLAFSIKLHEESFFNVIDSISFIQPDPPQFIQQDSPQNKNFLKIKLKNCPIIESWQPIFITYDKDLISPQYRLKDENNCELRMFINYRAENKSIISSEQNLL